MRLHYLIAQKMYRINLQYRFTQLINALGSALFGYIMVFIWRAAAAQRGGLGVFTTKDLVLWVAFAQVLFNFVFARTGLRIQDSVRNGNISLEFLRPLNYFTYIISRETGRQFYNLVYRCIPILVLYSFTVGYHIPTFKQALLLIPVTLSGVYISLCLSYVVGISALWTTDVRGAQAVHFAIFNLAAGVMVPVSLVPGLFGKVLSYSPWACLINPACNVFLGLYDKSVLLLPFFWSVFMTVICLVITRIGRQKLEVQGG